MGGVPRQAAEDAKAGNDACCTDRTCAVNACRDECVQASLQLLVWLRLWAPSRPTPVERALIPVQQTQ
eukprot:9805901-Lingulodinium_polyedra.AAC.1